MKTPFFILALALLAGCAANATVESVVSAPESAAAGGSAGSSTKYVTVRMDADGSLRSFDTRAVGLKAGERVEITPEGRLRHR
jgi:hypothetical protein